SPSSVPLRDLRGSTPPPSAPGEETHQEIEEVLRVGEAVGVVISAPAEARREEIEEVLRVQHVVGVPVAPATEDADEVLVVVEIDPADVLAPGVPAEAPGRGVVACRVGGRRPRAAREVDPADVLAPGETRQ